jgi:putative Mg2+ transporter-C (MgtC) family protein
MLLPALLAALCGGVVGLEREIRDKPAGLKTNALICLGAAMYVYLGELITQESSGDPTRIPGQVITGMGFLGAGAIFRDRGSVLGLTTAATLWTVTAIGLFVGTKHYALGIMLTATTLGVLIFLRVAERLAERLLVGKCEFHEGKVVFRDTGDRTRAHLIDVLQSYEPSRSRYSFAPAADHMSLTFHYCDRHDSHRQLLLDLWQVEGVRDVQSSLTNFADRYQG